MSYRIEITADTLAELAGKAASLAAKLNAPDQGVWWEQTDAPQKLKKQLDREVAEAAPVNPTPAAKSAPTATVPASSSITTAETSTPAPAPEEPAADVPDFDAVVTPLVLKLVEVKGKPAAQEMLGRFGVIKASQLSSQRWQELVDAINDELDA